MLFYASLFLFCVVVASIVVWLYRSVEDVAKQAYRAFLPSSKQNQMRRKTRKRQQVHLNPALESAASPWGWGNEGGPRRAVPVKRAVPAKPDTTPWGWEGSGAKGRRQSTRLSEEVTGVTRAMRERLEGRANHKPEDKPVVGWPYREEKFEFSGKEYKVTRKPKAKISKKSTVSKPWGW
jgi:hypothetical protein